MVQGVTDLIHWHDITLPVLAVGFVMIGTSALLFAGCLTRFAASVATVFCVASMFSWFPGPASSLLENRMTAALATAITAAVVCLGPGAFSLDARLFGRREIIIPKTPSNSQKALG
jgi:uncharacterized membrane protein YphA (DoxX/SURF4 family)